jgi:hypothetical protein
MTKLLRKKISPWQPLIAAAIVSLCPVGTAAAEEKLGWQYNVILYGWYSGIDTTIKSPGPLGSQDDIQFDASDLLDNLEMALMGTIEARYNKWSIITDVIYLGVGDEATTTLTVGPEPGRAVNATADVDIDSWVVNAGVGYDLAQADWGRFVVVGGLRYLSADIDGKFGLGGPFPIERSHSNDFWNGIVGFKGYFTVGEKWFVPYHADIGTGDSDLTWQLFGGIGYRFGWGDIMLGYRHLAFDQSDDNIVQDLEMNGPIMGAAFHF